MTKVVIIGPERSGKKQLCRIISGQSFDESETPLLIPEYRFLSKRDGQINISHERLNLDDDQQDTAPASLIICTIPGNKRFRGLWPMYYLNADILLYCVNLSESFDQKTLENTAMACKERNPNCLFVLVATKTDLYSQEAQGMLHEVNSEWIDYKYLTSSKIPGSKHCKELTQFLFQRSQAAFYDDEEQTRKRAISKNYPPRYTHLWVHARMLDQTIRQSEPLKDYYSALNLLKDYVKISDNWPCFFSEVYLFITGHWNRHHTSSVKKTLIAVAKSPEQSVEIIIAKLTEALLESQESINPQGSLARRLLFIQEQTGITINLDELNEQIKQRQSLSQPQICSN
ncbi:hypothetical protein EAS68_09845 [Legionella jordanis]|uniref:DUF5617 domain-containing protein n=1 Tax=Legionella jordanis TaxID=456 RepID=UPI000F00699E|nr:DUF5617 domain-containing protein [Legionella jordanis]RMX17926.1 hypothetical protein EAS68_09845 [Legionella jordanis]